jgi:hypothetical protein
MAKAPIAAAGATEPRPKALDVLVGIVDIVLTFRFAERTPTLSDVARVVSTASRLLRFSNLDERIETKIRLCWHSPGRDSL